MTYTDRSSAVQIAQFGLETAFGTGVAATKRLPSYTIDFIPKPETKPYHGSSGKFVTSVVPGKMMSEWKVKGPATFDEITYLLQSNLLTATSAIQGSGPGYAWGPLTPSLSGQDTPQSFTIEKGSAQGAEKVTYSLLHSLDFSWSMSDFMVSGTGMAQQLQTGVTLTNLTNAADVLVSAIAPGDVSFYIDSSSANLGTTQLMRILKADWKTDNRWGPIFSSGNVNNTYNTHVEIEPKLDIKLTMGADSQFTSELSDLVAGTEQFLRIKCLGPLISTGVYYTLQFDYACIVSAVSDIKNDNGLYCTDVTLQPIQDATWGKCMNVTLINKLASL